MALTTFSDLVQEARERVKRDALAAGLPDDGKPLRDGGTGATAYADAVAVYLGVRGQTSRQIDWSIACALGQLERDRMRNTFGRQALPMVWDYRRSKSVLRTASGNFDAMR